jgi:EH domain-containing protein 1
MPPPLPATKPSVGVKADQLLEKLKLIYKYKILPAEEAYSYGDLYDSPLGEAEIDAKPMVLLLGQYSVGKTSFIEYLLGREYPGQRIGPEPTTDRFVAVMNGVEERTIPGNALCAQKDQPFSSLSLFGNTFLSKFEAATCPSSVLSQVTIVDTPGVLSGEKQRLNRGYDFVKVFEWFAHRSDLIILMFDAHKLDISDEMKETMLCLRGMTDKVRIILNKADTVSPQQLLRIYGALMWSLGKVINTPEVLRVHTTSFTEKFARDENHDLFVAERNDLMTDIRSLPQASLVQRINAMVARARVVRVNCYLVPHFKKQMPALGGKAKKQAQLVENLLEEYKTVCKANSLNPNDFPSFEKYRNRLRDADFSKFKKFDEKVFQAVDEALNTDIPDLLLKLDNRSIKQAEEKADRLNPFAAEESTDWIVTPTMKSQFDLIFHSLPLDINGKASGAAVKRPMEQSGLNKEQLRLIWTLSDIDKDGCLDEDEFAVAMFLISVAQNGDDEAPLPASLKPSWIPPSKRSNLHP